MWRKAGPTLAQRYQNMQIMHSFVSGWANVSNLFIADSAKVTKTCC